MPWQERTVMSERQEFVAFARQEGANITALCRQFGISRKTASKWLGRAAAGERRFPDRSRRPHTSPHITPPEIEAAVKRLLKIPSLPPPGAVALVLALLAAAARPLRALRGEAR